MSLEEQSTTYITDHVSLTHTITLDHVCVSAFRTAERLKLLKIRNQQEQYFLKTKTNEQTK